MSNTLKTEIGIDEINFHVEALIGMIDSNNESIGLFTIMPANKWIEQAKTRPIPKMLFGSFWYEGEICILFADTNLGKSILAVQIGNSISKGSYIKGFALGSQKQPVLYFDFELSEKQFQNRYSIDYLQDYKFDDNFYRIEINPDANIPDGTTFESFLNESMEKSIQETEAKVLIIDNLTYLNNETEKAKEALPLMKNLKALKNKYGLSILVLAHTPKRDLSKPITRNDLAGSKMLINFVDSSFTIGESQKDKNLRYLKQIKVRQSEFIYDTENVCICQIEKPENFLQFDFIEYGSEREHLKVITESDNSKKISEALEMKKQLIPNTKIAEKLGVSEGAIRKWIKKAYENIVPTENEPKDPF